MAKRLDFPTRGGKKTAKAFGGTAEMVSAIKKMSAGIAGMGDTAKVAAKKFFNKADSDRIMFNSKKNDMQNLVDDDISNFDLDNVDDIDAIKLESKKKLIADTQDLTADELSNLKTIDNIDDIDDLFFEGKLPDDIKADFDFIDTNMDKDFLDDLNIKRGSANISQKRSFDNMKIEGDPKKAKKNADDIDTDANVSKSKTYCRKNPMTCGTTLAGTALLLGYTATALVDADKDEKRCIQSCLPDDWDEYVDYKKGNNTKLHPDKWIVDITKWPEADQLYWKSEDWANSSYLDADKKKQVKPTYKQAHAFMPRFYQSLYQVNGSVDNKNVSANVVSALPTDEDEGYAPDTYGFAYYKPKIVYSDDWSADSPIIQTIEIEEEQEPDEDGNIIGYFKIFAYPPDPNDEGRMITDDELQEWMDEEKIQITTQCEDGTIPDSDDPCDLKLVPEEEEMKDLFCTEDHMRALGIPADENGCKNYCKSKCQKSWKDYLTRKLGNDIKGASKGIFGALEEILSGFLDVFGQAMSFELIILMGIAFLFIVFYTN